MNLRIIADESVDFRIVVALRKIGLEVFTIVEERPSTPDEEILNLANKNEALLITEDKDFGELVFRLKRDHKGILFIRIVDPFIKIPRVAEAISKFYMELQGNFAVLDENKLRIKEPF